MLKGDICSEYCDYELYFRENKSTIEKMIYHVQNYLSVQDFYQELENDDVKSEMVMVFVGSLLVNNLLTIPKDNMVIDDEQTALIAKISGYILLEIYGMSLEAKGLIKRNKNTDWQLTDLGKQCGAKLLKDKTNS